MLLDTDVFIELLRKSPAALNWLRNLPSSPSLSGVAALEAAFGARDSAELRLVKQRIAEFTTLWPTAADLEHATLTMSALRLSHGIGALDAVTAALALRHGLPVVTFNVKHFQVVPGLGVIKPYTPT